MAENCKKALLIGYEDIVEVDVEGLDDLQRLVGGVYRRRGPAVVRKGCASVPLRER